MNKVAPLAPPASDPIANSAVAAVRADLIECFIFDLLFGCLLCSSVGKYFVEQLISSVRDDIESTQNGNMIFLAS